MRLDAILHECDIPESDLKMAITEGEGHALFPGENSAFSVSNAIELSVIPKGEAANLTIIGCTAYRWSVDKSWHITRRMYLMAPAVPTSGTITQNIDVKFVIQEWGTQAN